MLASRGASISRTDPERTSATSSNYTFLGHKEDVVVKQVSEAISAALGKNVVVTAGIHWDNLAPRDLGVIAGLTRRLTEKIIRQQQPARGKHRRKKGRKVRGTSETT